MGLFNFKPKKSNNPKEHLYVSCCANCRYYNASAGRCTNHANQSKGITYTDKTDRCGNHTFR